MNKEKTLLEQTFEVISLSQEKGFKTRMPLASLMWENWTEYETIFANTTCAVLIWWLRKEHNIIVWIEPTRKGLFAGFVDVSAVSKKDSKGLIQVHESDRYEEVCILGIACAVGFLPDKI